MKTATMLLAASALLTHAAAMPISTDEDISNLHLPADPNNVSPLVSRDTSSLHPRCTWHDGHGTVNCDTFSVVFGDGSISGGTNLVTISGNNFREKWSVNCDKPDEWKNFNTPLPYVVVIQMGNACRFSPSLPSTWYDGTVRTCYFLFYFFPFN